jgi:hypothetical protein
VDAEFSRLIVPVLVIGIIISGIGVTILVLAFRAFGTADSGKKGHIKLMAALLAFVLACCIGLFIASFQ